MNNFEPLHLDLQGWHGDHPIFAELIDKIKPKVILEVGSWKGQSAITMAKALKNLGIFDTRIYCIDTWLGSEEMMTRRPEDKERDLRLVNGYPTIYNQFLSNIIQTGVFDLITAVPNTSVIGARVVPNGDLIYVDASHDYESVKQDIKIYWEKLNKGGIMFGDDYNTWDGVKKAVNELFPSATIIDGNFWIVNK
jgi:hypothetical protein